MPFVANKGAATRHDVYAYERQPSAIIRATGSAVAALVGQFPWGPDASVLDPGSIRDLVNLLAPDGAPRTGSGYLSIIRKAWPKLKVVRVTGTGAAIAACPIPAVTPKLTVNAAYKGVLGNSIVATVSDATSGNVAKFKLTLTLSGASGTTTEVFDEIDATTTTVPPSTAGKTLAGVITAGAAGRPVNGTYTFSGGSDGTVASSDYIGTALSGDKGIARLEGDKAIRHVFVDDCGSLLRAAVNAGLVAHANLMGDRVAYVNGNTGLSKSAAVTDKGNYVSPRVVYAAPWAQITDDVDGTTRLVPPAAFAASVAAQLSPSTSIAWKSTVVGDMLSGIVGLESDFGPGVADLTNAGIAALVREIDGQGNAAGYRFEAGVVTIASADATKRNLTRTRMGDYIATSIMASLRNSVDAPNVPLTQGDLLTAVVNFLEGLKAAAAVDPINSPHILDYSVLNLQAYNTQAQLDAGDFTIPIDVKTSSALERIFLGIRFGETVAITAS